MAGCCRWVNKIYTSTSHKEDSKKFEGQLDSRNRLCSKTFIYATLSVCFQRFCLTLAVDRSPISMNCCPITLNPSLICGNSGLCPVINFHNFPFVIPLLHANYAVPVSIICYLHAISMSCLLPAAKLFTLRNRYPKTK